MSRQYDWVAPDPTLSIDDRGVITMVGYGGRTLWQCGGGLAYCDINTYVHMNRAAIPPYGLESWPVVARGNVGIVGTDLGLVYRNLSTEWYYPWRVGPAATAAPLFASGLAVYTANWSVVAVDVAAASVTWTASVPGAGRSAPALSGDGAHAIAGSSDGGLNAVSMATGSVAWRMSAGAAVTTTPAVHGGSVYVTTSTLLVQVSLSASSPPASVRALAAKTTAGDTAAAATPLPCEVAAVT